MDSPWHVRQNMLMLDLQSNTFFPLLFVMNTPNIPSIPSIPSIPIRPVDGQLFVRLRRWLTS